MSLHRPSRFRRPRLLVVGCGDVGLRVVRLLRGRFRLIVLTRDAARRDALRAAGAVPVVGDLDALSTLARLAGLCDAVLHLAPPQGDGDTDRRSAALLTALARHGPPARLVYISTTGVYGDAGGALFDETRASRPATGRARRRVDAEQRVRLFGRTVGACATILRVPGIYALDRPGGDPRERVRRGTPVLRPEDDVHTSHIHADDLARACVAALFRGRPQRVVHISDDTRLKMGDHFDLVADLSGLPRPPRIGRAEAEARFSPMQRSFMGESRQLLNQRMKRELKLRLRYPTVADGIRSNRLQPFP